MGIETVLVQWHNAVYSGMCTLLSTFSGLKSNHIFSFSITRLQSAFSTMFCTNFALHKNLL